MSPETNAAIDVDPTRLVFIGGLHRSGTTALGRVLAAHPGISGFAHTGAIEDEGQHLQKVYVPAQSYGGPGRFARRDAAHLGPLAEPQSSDARARLLQAWTPHWDLDCELLVEKSPPNMIMGRYLQSVFPGSALVVIVRHPVIVALSTKKWRRGTGLRSLVEHWFIAHDRMRADAPHLDRLHVLRYEDLISDPTATLGELGVFLGLNAALPADLIQQTRSDVYVERWSRMASGSVLDRARRRDIEKRFAERAADYGYDIADVATPGTDWPPEDLRR